MQLCSETRIQNTDFHKITINELNTIKIGEIVKSNCKNKQTTQLKY